MTKTSQSTIDNATLIELEQISGGNVQNPFSNGTDTGMINFQEVQVTQVSSTITYG